MNFWGNQCRAKFWFRLWVSRKSFSLVGDGCVPSRCVTLMPYTLVSPRFPPICRPVVLLPTLLGRVLHKRLAEQEGYQLCEPGKNIYFFLIWKMEKGDTLEKTLPLQWEITSISILNFKRIFGIWLINPDYMQLVITLYCKQCSQNT